VYVLANYILQDEQMEAEKDSPQKRVTEKRVTEKRVKKQLGTKKDNLDPEATAESEEKESDEDEDEDEYEESDDGEVEGGATRKRKRVAKVYKPTKAQLKHAAKQRDAQKRDDYNEQCAKVDAYNKAEEEKGSCIQITLSYPPEPQYECKRRGRPKLSEEEKKQRKEARSQAKKTRGKKKASETSVEGESKNNSKRAKARTSASWSDPIYDVFEGDMMGEEDPVLEGKTEEEDPLVRFSIGETNIFHCRAHRLPEHLKFYALHYSALKSKVGFKGVKK